MPQRPSDAPRIKPYISHYPDPPPETCERYGHTVPLGGIDGDECPICAMQALFVIGRSANGGVTTSDFYGWAGDWIDSWIKDECPDSLASDHWLARIKSEPAEVIRLWLYSELPPEHRDAVLRMSEAPDAGPIRPRSHPRNYLAEAFAIGRGERESVEVEHVKALLRCFNGKLEAIKSIAAEGTL